jgi:hypothetical protein
VDSFWVRKLYQTLNPPVPALGSWAYVNPTALPESQRAFEILRSWCRDILASYSGKREEQELSRIYQVADLSFHLDRQTATSYVHTSELVQRLRHQDVFQRGGSIFTIPELLGALDASHPWCLWAGLLFVKFVPFPDAFINRSTLTTRKACFGC